MATTVFSPGAYTVSGLSPARTGIAESFQRGMQANLSRQDTKQVMQQRNQQMALAQAEEQRRQQLFEEQQRARAAARARAAQIRAAQQANIDAISKIAGLNISNIDKVAAPTAAGMRNRTAPTMSSPGASPAAPTAGVAPMIDMAPAKMSSATGVSSQPAGVQVAGLSGPDAFRMAMEARPDLFGAGGSQAVGGGGVDTLADASGAVPTRTQELADYAQSLVRMQGSYTREDLEAAGFTPAEIAAYETGIVQPGLTSEAVADIETRYGPLQTPQGGSPAIVNIQRDIATKLADPNLTPENRRALETRQTALDLAVRTGYGVTDAVTDAAAFLQRVGTSVLEYGVGAPLSIASPELGGQFYEQVGRWNQATDELARMGQTIPGPMLSEQLPTGEKATPTQPTQPAPQAGATPAQPAPQAGLTTAPTQPAAPTAGPQVMAASPYGAGINTNGTAAQAMDTVAAQTGGDISQYFLRNPVQTIRIAEAAYMDIQQAEAMANYYKQIGDLAGFTAAQKEQRKARVAYAGMIGQLALAGLQLDNYGPLQVWLQSQTPTGDAEVRPYTDGTVELIVDGKSIGRPRKEEIITRLAEINNEEYRAQQAAARASAAELSAKAFEQQLKTQGLIAVESVKARGQLDLELLKGELENRNSGTEYSALKELTSGVVTGTEKVNGEERIFYLHPVTVKDPAGETMTTYSKSYDPRM